MSLTSWERLMQKQQRPVDPPTKKDDRVRCKGCDELYEEEEVDEYGFCSECRKFL
jgi:hypothetical protein